GHGMVRVPVYAGQARTGKVDGHATPGATLTRPGALMIDAAHGFAYPALELAMSNLPGMARAQGIAVAGVNRSHHAGVAGWFVERLAQDGLVAMMFANTPAAMAPTGGRQALFGTNPIAFAAPVADELPMVVDLSLSTVARGKILAAAQKGEPIPEGWATDANGSPTTDAQAALGGTMQPMGGAKGAALALMVEVLAAGLTGATLAADAPDFFAPDGPPPGTGQLLLAIDPEALGGGARIAELAAMFAGNGEARLPGRRRQRLSDAARTDGLEIDKELLRKIEATGQD
ncbi:MAG: Ldh family oxidoreductase, partial [Pseudomonadota bacterium]